MIAFGINLPIPEVIAVLHVIVIIMLIKLARNKY